MAFHFKHFFGCFLLNFRFAIRRMSPERFSQTVWTTRPPGFAPEKRLILTLKILKFNIVHLKRKLRTRYVRTRETDLLLFSTALFNSEKCHFLGLKISLNFRIFRLNANSLIKRPISSKLLCMIQWLGYSPGACFTERRLVCWRIPYNRHVQVALDLSGRILRPI